MKFMQRRQDEYYAETRTAQYYIDQCCGQQWLAMRVVRGRITHRRAFSTVRKSKHALNTLSRQED